MRIDWAIPCVHARVEEDGRVSAIEDFGFDTLWVDPFPSGLEFIALIRAAGLPEDFAEEADRGVEVYLLGPGMEPLLHLEFDLPAGVPRVGHLAGWELHSIIPVVIQFTPAAEGTHMLEFRLRGRVQPYTIPFQVRAGEPPVNLR